MNTDFMTLNEVLNNGNVIHLYKQLLTGVWISYGYSAYLLHLTVSANQYHTLQGFSIEMQMPWCMVHENDVSQVCGMIESVVRSDHYIKLTISEYRVTTDGYNRWTNALKSSTDITK